MVSATLRSDDGHRAHRGTPLLAVPAASRFSDPQAGYAVLYTAETVSFAFWETLGRNRFAWRWRRELPRTEAEAALVVSIACDALLVLVDLRGDGPVRIGAPSAVADDGNPVAGRGPRRRSRGEGIVFASRLTGDSCVAIFERAFGRLRATGIGELVRHAELLEALDEYHIVLTRPPRWE